MFCNRIEGMFLAFQFSPGRISASRSSFVRPFSCVSSSYFFLQGFSHFSDFPILSHFSYFIPFFLMLLFLIIPFFALFSVSPIYLFYSPSYLIHFIHNSLLFIRFASSWLLRLFNFCSPVLISSTSIILFLQVFNKILLRSFNSWSRLWFECFFSFILFFSSIFSLHFFSRIH